MYAGRKGRVVSVCQHQGDRLVVGEDALLQAGSSYLKTIEDLVHYYPVFVGQAAREAGVEGEVRVVAGLPYNVWHAEKDKPAGLVATLRKVLQASGHPEVMVLPQGLGGVRLYLDNAGEISGNILGIDIGFNTVIFTLYSPQTQTIIFGDTFHKRGVHQMATQLLLPAIRDLAPSRSFTPVEVSYLIERGYLQYGFERHDITGHIAQAAKTYIENILRDIHGELQAHVGLRSEFDTVLLFGGGATLIREQVAARTIRVVILQEPEFANAAGFRLIAEKNS
jgi:hypothetical protein